jgi:hypothetical protein
MIHVFQAAHTVPQAQNIQQRSGRLGKNTFETEALRPVLQDVGELAGRQSQQSIQRHPLDPLTFARAVDNAADGQGAKDGAVGAGVGHGQTLAGRTSGGDDLFAAVAVAGSSDKGGEQGMSELQEVGEKSPLNAIDTVMFVMGRLNEGKKVEELLVGLAESLLLAHEHRYPPW